MPDALARRCLVFYVAVVTYVLAVSVAIDRLDRYDAWTAGAGGTLMLGIVVWRIGRI